MQTNTLDKLQSHYRSLPTEALIGIAMEGGLTDEAKFALDMILKGRNVPENEYLILQNEIIESRPNELLNPLAYPMHRVFAKFIDFIVSILLMIPVSFVVTRFNNENLVYIIVITPIAYLLFADALPHGQSVGKRLLSICVIDNSNGLPCSVWQSFIRNILFLAIGLFDLFRLNSPVFFGQ